MAGTMEQLSKDSRCDRFSRDARGKSEKALVPPTTSKRKRQNGFEIARDVRRLSNVAQTRASHAHEEKYNAAGVGGVTMIEPSDLMHRTASVRRTEARSRREPCLPNEKPQRHQKELHSDKPGIEAFSKDKRRDSSLSSDRANFRPANQKQVVRIIRLIQMAKEQESLHFQAPTRHNEYQYESRHNHSVRRKRHSTGRFVMG